MLLLYCLLQSFLINNTVNCSSKFWRGSYSKAIWTSSLGELRGFMQLPPFLEEHILMFWLLFMVSSLFFSSSFLMEGMKPSLYRWHVPLSVGRSILYQRGRLMLSFLLTWGYLPISLPPLLCLALSTVTQFCEWLHSSLASLSTSINWHWHHSLHLKYVFLPRSAARSHYLRSSPIPTTEVTTSCFSTPGKLYW